MSTRSKAVWQMVAAAGLLIAFAIGTRFVVRRSHMPHDTLGDDATAQPQTIPVSTPIGSKTSPIPLSRDTPNDTEPPLVKETGLPDAAPAPSTSDAGPPRLTTMGDLYRQLSEIKTGRGSRELNHALAALGRKLALENFDNAMRLLRAVSDFHTRLGLARGIFELRGVVNGPEAFRLAATFNPGDADASPGLQGTQERQFYYEAMIASLRGWSFTNPSEAAGAIASLPEAYTGAAAAVVYGEWSKADPWAALASAQSLDADVRSHVIPIILQGWANADAPGAWDYTLRQSEVQLPGRNRLLASIATTWAEQDVAAALQRVDSSITDDAEYAEVVERMARALFRKSPESAAHLFAAVPGLYQKQPAILIGAIEAWTRSAPEAAATWAENAPAGDMRGVALKGVAAYWAQQDFDAALDWASHFSDQVDRAYALSNVAVQQGERHPDRTTAWIFSERDEFVQARAIAGYITGGVRRGGDAQTAEALRRHIMGDAIDLTYVETALNRARIPEAQRSSLHALLER